VTRLNDLLSPTDSAVFCGVSRTTIDRWAEAGRITPVDANGYAGYRKGELRKIRDSKNKLRKSLKSAKPASRKEKR